MDWEDAVISKPELEELKSLAGEYLKKHDKLSEEMRKRLLDLLLYDHLCSLSRAHRTTG